MILFAVWAASVMLGVTVAALLPRTRWWVGLIACSALGPVGLLLVAVDVATWQPASN